MTDPEAQIPQPTDEPRTGEQYDERYRDPNKTYVNLDFSDSSVQPRWVSPDVIEGDMRLTASGRVDHAAEIRTEARLKALSGRITRNGNIQIVYEPKTLPEGDGSHQLPAHAETHSLTRRFRGAARAGFQALKETAELFDPNN